MGMIRRICSLALVVTLLAGCDAIDRINAQAYREYHASRWQAVVTAYALHREAVELPVEPPAPPACTGMDDAYRGIIGSTAAVREGWRALDDQSRVSIEFVAEMLDVLVSRDTVNIELLAPQIDDYFNGHQQLRGEWEERRRGVAGSVTALEGRWTEIWPEQDLGFDLLADARALAARLPSDPDAARRAALEHYHANEYDRLAMIYLDYQPAAPPQPVSHIPEGCDDLATALADLEAGLLVRYSMDQAIEQDVTRIQQLAAIDLTNTPWSEIEIPQGRYARPRVSAAIARLKLLKYLDVLLTDSLDVLVGEVDLEWRLVWPGHYLETSVFAYAGLPEAGTLPPDPLVEQTLRR